jgi:hypothetical protein
MQWNEVPKCLYRWIYFNFIGEKMAETITVNKEAIIDLVRVKEEFDSIVESLELMADKEFMNSYNKAKEQIKKRDFVDWNEL